MIVEPLVNDINIRLNESISLKDDKALGLANTMELYDNVKQRKAGEGSVLVFGEKATMKRRVVRNQVKSVVTCVYQNDLDGTVQYDISPIQERTLLRFSEFDIVKSAGYSY